MPQKPTMPSPYMETVDALKPITFSCNINSRDTIVDYEFNLDKINSEGTDNQNYILPPIFVGSEEGGTAVFKYKLSFYKETLDSDEYTLVVEPTATCSEGQVTQYLSSSGVLDGAIGGVSVVSKSKIIRIIYIKGVGEFIPKHCFESFTGLKKCEIYGSFAGVANRDVSGIVMGSSVFSGCNALEEVIYPKGIIYNTSIPKCLKRATIYSGTGIINSSRDTVKTLFNRESKIEELTIRTDVLDVANNSFNLCCKSAKTLKSVFFTGNGEANIGESAFYNCNNLKNVFTETSKISSIGEKAFYNTGLEEIIINGNLTSIGKQAFSNCKSLSSIYVYGINDNIQFATDLEICKNSGDNGNIKIYYLGGESSITSLKLALMENTDNVELVSMYESDNFTSIPIYGGNGVLSNLSHTKDAGALEVDQEYYWYVKLKDSLGKEIVSPKYYFKTCGTSNVKIDKFLKDGSKEVYSLTPQAYFEVDYEIHQGSPITVEKKKNETTNEDENGNLSGEDIENLEDIFFCYTIGKKIYRNLETSVQLQTKEDESGNMIYYFELAYEPISDSDGNIMIYISNIDMDVYLQKITEDDGSILYKLIADATTDVLEAGDYHRLSYDCYFDACEVDEYYIITYFYVAPLEGYSRTFSASYNMESILNNYIPIKSHKWKLYEKSNNKNVLIDETGEVFGAYLSYTYNKFLPGKSYILEIEVENDEGLTVFDTYEFSTANIDGAGISVLPSVYTDRAQNAVIIDFTDCSYENSYSVIRKDVINGKYKSIAESVRGGCRVYDYTAASNREYIYTVYELNTEGVLSACDLDTIIPKWTGTGIIGFSGSYADKGIIKVEKENIWNFGLNAEPREYSQVLSRNIVSSIGSRYAKSIIGKSNYRTFSVNGLFGNINCTGEYVSDTAFLLDKWDEFIASFTAKLISDTKGHILICDATDSSYGYDDEYVEQPTTINVSFVEIAPSDNISLVRIERGD